MAAQEEHNAGPKPKTQVGGFLEKGALVNVNIDGKAVSGTVDHRSNSLGYYISFGKNIPEFGQGGHFRIVTLGHTK